MGEVVMPRLSDSMEEGTIVRWLKADGDEVSRGDELVEIETDKATMTYEADEAGVLETVAGEGDTLPIGEVIARIGEGAGAGGGDASGEGESEAAGDTDEAAAEDDRAREAADGDAQDADDAGGDDSEEGDDDAEDSQDDPGDGGRPQDAPAAKDGDGQPPSGQRDGGERVKASPVARRIAREHGVDIAALSGSGPGGRVVKADVEQAAERGAASNGDGAVPGESQPGRGEVSVQELSRAQQVIARRMAESRATVPDFTLRAEVDMEAALAAREQFKAVAGDRAVPSLNDMVVKACALALRDFPRANGSYRDGRFELHGRVNVGVAVATEDGLVVPTVFDADAKPLGRIAEEARALAEKVREGRISPPEVSNGTFTVSNLGMFGVSSFTAVINPPQAAILAVGSVEPRAVAREGELAVRHTMAMTLGCDHRILYGAEAARFLGRVRELLEHPAALAL